MSITLEDALKNELISDKLLRMIPSKCKCGSDLIFSNSLKELKCSNKKCIYNVIDRINRLNIKFNIGMDEYDIVGIVRKLNLTTPYQLFMFDEAYKSGIIANNDIRGVKDVIQNIKNLKDDEYFIYNIVEMCGITKITKVARKLFEGFESFDEVYEEIEQSQVTFISERLGIKSSDSSIFAVDIYNTLLDIKDELIFGETQLKVKKYDKQRVKIAFSDNVLPFLNKGELIDYLNNTYNYQFVTVSTITENTDILVRNGDNNTSKCRVARIINDKYVAECMNNNKLTLSDINKFVAGQLKPLGCKIYVDSLDNILTHLNNMETNHNGEQSV